MSDKIIENNQVTVIGEVVSEFTYSHEVFGEGFYMVELLVKRLSNSCDRIPVMISERLIDVSQDCRGECLMVSGQFRSYNRHEELKNRLVLSVFAREIEDGWRLSLRSNQYINVSDVCIMFGGGGHPRAAGATITGNIEEVKEKILTQIKRYIRK